jgi:hypothetical protein
VENGLLEGISIERKAQIRISIMLEGVNFFMRKYGEHGI